MDVDAFTAVHGADWERLNELVRRRRLTGADADELVRLYQRAATHLSLVQSTAPDPALISHLSMLLARSRSRIAGAGAMSLAPVRRFVVLSLPAALYRSRNWALGVMAAFIFVAVAAGWWMATEPGVQAMFGTEDEIATYVNESFAAYYSSGPAPEFAAQVWSNNAWIAAQCVAFGITGIWPAMVMALNAINVGAAGGIMVANDAGMVFFGLILPHGLLELTAIFVAGGAGLKLFWSWVAPGPRTRSAAVQQEGRALFTIAGGLVVVLGVAGFIEAFITPASIPGALKIAIGAIALAAYWFYVVFFGRRAVAEGETGDLEAFEAGELVPTSG